MQKRIRNTNQSQTNMNKISASHYPESTGLATVFSKLCNCKNPERPSKPSLCKSAEVDSPVNRPDLAIYSQTQAIQNGNVPSWDSPDIITNNWRPFRLNPEATIKVRNLSPTVAAINSQVHFYTSAFGIGTRRVLKLTRIISLGAGQEVSLNFPLDQETLNGDQRIGVHIQLEHPHDEQLINNFGSQVHDGSYTTESGRNFTLQIPVLNDSPSPRQINLQLMPTELIASVNPASHAFGPYEQIIVTLSVSVPAFLSGSASNVINREVTMVGRLATGELIGGITKLLRIDN
jgi:hypothetical protein